MNTLVWFRADLRTHDHPALYHAAMEGRGGVIGVFVVSAEQWLEHDWAAVKVDFLPRHLRELSVALARLNIPLLIGRTPRFDGQPELLLKLARDHGCDSLYFNDEYEVNEARRDGTVKDLFAANGLAVRSFTDQCVVAPGELRTGEGRAYTVFTPFRKALYAKLVSRGPLEPLTAPRRQSAMPVGVTPSPIPASIDGFRSTVDRARWPAGEEVALQKLRDFAGERIREYKDARDLPALDGTSTLSPYLAVGSITHRQCMAAALRANDGCGRGLGQQGLEPAAERRGTQEVAQHSGHASNNGRFDTGDAGIVSWISEIAWREFYRHILHAFPRVCMGRAFKPATERIRWSDNDEHFAAWCEGRTGVPIVDAGMRQLREIGWMHNRVRIIVAMCLTKDLFIDWRRGERHFMRHLIDGDLASNNGGWQWSASTGTDAAPYFRIFNPITQSRRFDAAGEYIRRYVPELAGLEGGEDGPIHNPSELPPLARAGLNYPEPLVDRTKVKGRVVGAFQALIPR